MKVKPTSFSSFMKGAHIKIRVVENKYDERFFGALVQYLAGSWGPPFWGQIIFWHHHFPKKTQLIVFFRSDCIQPEPTVFT